jgi:ribonuclease BN (tRNA processing enzyme)
VSIDTLRIDFCDTDHGNHAQAGENCESFAYRFKESVSRSQVAIVTDHEARIGDANAKVVRFAKHADLLIHDAQFDDNEYAERIGWGHSSIRQSLENALKIKARKVLLTHHDPGRTDQALDSLLAAYKANAQFREVDFDFAREDEVYDVQSS